VRFSTDGQRIITARGKTAMVWDDATGAAITSFASHETDVIWSSFALGGKSILTISIDGEARIWDHAPSETGDAFHVACQRLLDTKMLDRITVTFGLADLKPICAAGHEPIAFERDRLIHAELGRPANGLAVQTSGLTQRRE
jgi:WD40 repeat protein